jgi:hypothetical protein
MQKRGVLLSFPVSSLYPIRSEEKGARSLAKDCLARDWRACPRASAYGVIVIVPSPFSVRD